MRIPFCDKMNNVESFIIFFCGFFSTMPIVAITIGNRSVSLFTIALFFELVVMLFHASSHPLKIGKYSRYIFIWLVLSLVSLESGLLLSASYPEMEAVFSYFFKIIIYLFFIVNWTGRENINTNNAMMCRGLILGSGVNILWGVIDAVALYSKGILLSHFVFANYMRINHLDHIGIILSNGLYRTGGLNYDPAHLGFICPFLAMYALSSKHKYLLIFVVAGCLASASNTGIVCTGIEFLLWGIKRLSLDIKMETKVHITRFFLFLGLLFIICNVIYIYREQLMNNVDKAFDLFYARVNYAYLSSPLEENIRGKFILFFPDVLLGLGGYSLFGTGFGSSSFGYSYEPFVAQAMGYRYKLDSISDIENTYLAYILDTGIIGAAVFFFGMIRIYFYYNNNENKLIDDVSITAYAGIVSMLLSFLFYHYILFAPQVLLMIIAASNADNQERMKCNPSLPLKHIENRV